MTNEKLVIQRPPKHMTVKHVTVAFVGQQFSFARLLTAPAEKETECLENVTAHLVIAGGSKQQLQTART